MLKKLKPSTTYALLQVSVLLLLNGIVIWASRQEEGIQYFATLQILWYLRSCVRIVRSQTSTDQKRQLDTATIFFTVLFLWQLLVGYLKLGDPVLYPTPIRILSLMVQEFPRFTDNFRYSLMLLSISFSIGLLTAFPLGLLIGSNARVREALSGYIKILSPISPIAYIPYVIGIMPTFRAASLFVIYTGTFWPILKWTIFGVQNLDPAYTLNANLLQIKHKKYYWSIVIPAILPSVLSGVSQSLTGGFGILVAAEMIGSRKGLGFAIKYFADFLNYHMVLTNILYLGIAISIITWLYEKLQARILSWQVLERKGSRAIHR